MFWNILFSILPFAGLAIGAWLGSKPTRVELYRDIAKAHRDRARKISEL